MDFLIKVVIVASVLGASVAAQAGDNKPPSPSWEVRLDFADPGGGNIYVTNCGLDHTCAGQSYSLTTADKGIQAQLKNLHAGDHLRDVQADDKGQIVSLAGLDYWVVSYSTRVFTLIVFALILLGLAAAATGGAPQRLIIGDDNRYSTSKFQVAAWFWLLLTVYLSTVFLRVKGPGWDFLGSVNIPQNLLLLSGLSALTFGGAKAITTAKVNASIAAGVADPKPVARAPSFFADLVKNDGTAAPAAPGSAAPALNTAVRSFDLGDFQMLVVTLTAFIMYLLIAFHFLGTIEFSKSISLPDVDTTILSAFGLGQGAYLVKKAAGNVGTS